MKLIRVPLVMLALLLAFAVVPSAVLAHEGETESDDTAQQEADETTKKLEEQRREAAEKRAEEAKEALSKLTENAKERFKKACENRRESYKKRIENIAERSKKHVEVLDKIVERVKSFKEDKNLTVANYDALLEQVETKKLVVENLQETIKTQAEVEFNCERGATLEQVKAFGDVLHQQIDALKEYKTAVKNLIVAVKTSVDATKTEEGDDNESQQ